MLVRLLSFLEMDKVVKPRPDEDSRAGTSANILRAFVAKAALGIPHTRAPLRRLHGDVYDLASAVRLATQLRHSRRDHFLAGNRADFAATEAPTDSCRADPARLCGPFGRPHQPGTYHRGPGARKNSNKPKVVHPRASRRKDRTPEQMSRLERQCLPGRSLQEVLAEVPRDCDKGYPKNDSKGLPTYWIGYKLRVDVADGQIPITALLTSASLHDSQVAVPLVQMTAERVTSLYDLMDKGYDSHSIREFSRRLGHVPIIGPQKRGAEPAILASHERVRFRERTTVEREYSRFKDQFGGRFLRVRGSRKVMAHLRFGLLALTVDQLLRLLPADPALSPPVPCSYKNLTLKITFGGRAGQSLPRRRE